MDADLYRLLPISVLRSSAAPPLPATTVSPGRGAAHDRTPAIPAPGPGGTTTGAAAPHAELRGDAEFAGSEPAPCDQDAPGALLRPLPPAAPAVSVDAPGAPPRAGALRQQRDVEPAMCALMDGAGARPHHSESHSEREAGAAAPRGETEAERSPVSRTRRADASAAAAPPSLHGGSEERGGAPKQRGHARQHHASRAAPALAVGSGPGSAAARAADARGSDAEDGGTPGTATPDAEESVRGAAAAGGGSAPGSAAGTYVARCAYASPVWHAHWAYGYPNAPRRFGPGAKRHTIGPREQRLLLPRGGEARGRIPAAGGGGAPAGGGGGGGGRAAQKYPRRGADAVEARALLRRVPAVPGERSRKCAIIDLASWDIWDERPSYEAVPRLSHKGVPSGDWREWCEREAGGGGGISGTSIRPLGSDAPRVQGLAAAGEAGGAPSVGERAAAFHAAEAQRRRERDCDDAVPAAGRPAAPQHVRVAQMRGRRRTGANSWRHVCARRRPRSSHSVPSSACHRCALVRDTLCMRRDRTSCDATVCVPLYVCACERERERVCVRWRTVHTHPRCSRSRGPRWCCQWRSVLQRPWPPPRGRRAPTRMPRSMRALRRRTRCTSASSRRAPPPRKSAPPRSRARAATTAR